MQHLHLAPCNITLSHLAAANYRTMQLKKPVSVPQKSHQPPLGDAGIAIFRGLAASTAFCCHSVIALGYTSYMHDWGHMICDKALMILLFSFVQYGIILVFLFTEGVQSMTTSITFRTDAELKAEVEDILEDIGMNMSTAFNCFLAKIRDVGGIPFTLARKSKHQRLVDAYNEAKEVANDPNSPTCTDPDKIEEFMLS